MLVDGLGVFGNCAAVCLFSVRKTLCDFGCSLVPEGKRGQGGVCENIDSKQQC